MLERKLYQLIIGRLDGGNIHTPKYRDGIFSLTKKGIGGFILFGGRRDEIREFIGKLQSMTDKPLFIASDIERGVGQQVEGMTLFPCQMAMAAATDLKDPEDSEFLRKAIGSVASEARYMGINMPLIPIVDVNRNPENPIICTRAFSDDPDLVAWFGKRYIEILEDEGLLSCAKHFPGHGDTSIDSHISLPVIDKSYSELLKTDIFPFKGAVDAGVSCMMVGHLSVPALDTMPATVSLKVITGLLREELSFNGLVLTDALNMKALKDIPHLYTECIKAGADILLHPEDPDIAVRELKEDIRSRELSEDMLNGALSRIEKARGKIRPAVIQSPPFDYHRGISELMSDRAITVIKNLNNLLPLRNTEGIQVILAGDPGLHQHTPFRDGFIHVSSLSEVDNLEKRTAIFAVFTTVSAWRGSSGIEETQREKIIGLLKKSGKSIVISFGSPYALRYFKDADVLIAAYDVTVQAQTSAIRCLKGEIDFNGRLPINID